MSEVEISQSERNEFHNALLSSHTQRLYDRIKQHIELGGLKERWYHDNDLVRRTSLHHSQLDKAKSELSRSGLMVLIPGTVQTKFILPDEAE